MSNIEIEDVLSSIRRLVSDDVRSVQTRVRDVPEAVPPTPEAVMPTVVGGDPDLLPDEQVIADDAVRASAPPAALTLVLTSAQRISEAEEATAEDTAAAEDTATELAGWAADARGDAAPETVGAASSGGASSVSLEQTITELEAAVAGIGGEFEQDWGSGTDTGEASHDLEQIFRDPALRDRLTLEEAAGGLTAEGEPVVYSGLDTEEELLSGADDLLAEDDGWDGDDELSDDEPDADEMSDWAEADDADDMLSDDMVSFRPHPRDDAALDALLDQSITGDAGTMVFGPASDVSAAASASLAALIAAPATPKAPGRLHFAATTVPLATTDPVMTAELSDQTAPGDDPLEETAAAKAEDAPVDLVTEVVPDSVAEAANLTEAANLPDEPAEAIAVVEAAPRHPRILRSTSPAEIDDGDDETVDMAAVEADMPSETISAVDMPADEPEAANLFETAPEPEIDVDALRDIVAEIIRQELQGVLGERITRNVRKLVRREINRILETRKLE